MRSTSGNPLVRHDALLLRTEVQAALKGWSNRLTILIGVPLLALAVRHGVTSLDRQQRLLIGMAAGLVLAFGVLNFLVARIRYHRAEGVLAAAALQRGVALSYVTILMTIGVTIGFGLVALVAPGASFGFLAALPVGATLGILTNLISNRAHDAGRLAPFLRSLGNFIDRPVAGLIFAVPVALTILISVPRAELRDVVSIVGVLTALGALTLGRIEPARIRFMAQSGYSTWESVWLEARPLLVFGLSVVAIAATSLGIVGTAVVAVVATAALLIQPMAVMLYRSHGKRTAEILFTVLLGVLASVWFAIPPAGPFVHAMILWSLARRARSARWKIA